MKKAVIWIILILFILSICAGVYFFVLKKDDSPSQDKPDSNNEFIIEKTADSKFVYFGYYPQSIKADSVNINNVADENGYYLGSDGEKYLKHTSSTNITLADGKEIVSGEDCYFKLEKLKWRVLKEENGEALIVCDKVIDTSAFQQYIKQDTDYYIVDSSGNYIYEEDTSNRIYASNYQYSDLRKFLTQDFYNTAFSQKQKEIIKQKIVDNSADTTIDSNNSYVCENTNDYVFALSYADLQSEEYGFINSQYGQDANRKWYPTDYVSVLGVETSTSGEYSGTAKFWLRSPCHLFYGGYSQVVCDGYCYTNDLATTANIGIVPALYVSLD